MSTEENIPAGHADFENTLTPQEAEEFDRLAAEQIAKNKTYTPPPITGYRVLTQTEVDLMNRIKAKGNELEALINEVREHITIQTTGARDAELLRLLHTEPGRWASIGRTHLQEGLMALTRAVAQPTTF